MKARLARWELFDALEPQRLDAVLAHCEERLFRSGEALWRAGERAGVFDLIETGLVKVGHSNAAGDQVTLGLFGPGDAIGVGSALGGSRYPAEATAASERVQVIRVHAKPVLALLQHDAQFAHGLNRLLLHHTAVLRAKIDIVGAGAVPKRLAALFLYLVERFGHLRDGAVADIPIALTRQQMSELVDARIETVIRILSRWQKADWLRTLPDGFELRRVDMLQRIVAGG